MSQRRVNETSLTATADAIRAKLGTSDPITWVENEGFKAAVESIEAGGGEITGSRVVLTGESPTKDATINDISEVALVCENAETIGNDAFRGCTSLTTVDLPVATDIGGGAFYGCTSLATVALPAATFIGYDAFYKCTSLTTIDLPVAETVDPGAFILCSNLSTIILRKSDIICNFNLMSIAGTKIATEEGQPTGEGAIYVPAALYEDYVTNLVQQAVAGMGLDAATAEYLARNFLLRKIEDYPEICG